MNQQQQPQTNPYSGAGTFREEVLGAVRYQLELGFPERAEAYFNGAISLFKHLDIWSELEREKNQLIKEYNDHKKALEEEQRREAEERQARLLGTTLAMALQQNASAEPVTESEPTGEVEPSTEEECPYERGVMKKFHNGHPINFELLHHLIYEYFVKEAKCKYDWLAVWRFLSDKDLLEDLRLTHFAQQMQHWYPGAVTCTADSMGDYFEPYLGRVRFSEWRSEQFKRSKRAKQSTSGFHRLYNLCNHLHSEIKQVPVK